MLQAPQAAESLALSHSQLTAAQQPAATDEANSDGEYVICDKEDFVVLDREDAVEAIAYYIALYVARTPEAQRMEPRQLHEALQLTFKVRGPPAAHQQLHIAASTATAALHAVPCRWPHTANMHMLHTAKPTASTRRHYMHWMPCSTHHAHRVYPPEPQPPVYPNPLYTLLNPSPQPT